MLTNLKSEIEDLAIRAEALRIASEAIKECAHKAIAQSTLVRVASRYDGPNVVLETTVKTQKNLSN